MNAIRTKILSCPDYGKVYAAYYSTGYNYSATPIMLGKTEADAIGRLILDCNIGSFSEVISDDREAAEKREADIAASKKKANDLLDASMAAAETDKALA